MSIASACHAENVNRIGANAIKEMEKLRDAPITLGGINCDKA